MVEHEDYVLGRDVTKRARSVENRTTSIVSVRLSAEEMDALCAIAEREDKSLSQVVRDAVRDARSTEHARTGWTGTLSLESGGSFTFGDRRFVPTASVGDELNWLGGTESLVITAPQRSSRNRKAKEPAALVAQS